MAVESIDDTDDDVLKLGGLDDVKSSYVICFGCLSFLNLHKRFPLLIFC